MDSICKNCRHFQEFDDEEKASRPLFKGCCVRFPKQAGVGSQMWEGALEIYTEWNYPPVAYDESCGEFKAVSPKD